MPAVFTFLGIRNETAGSVHGLHTPVFTMDEAQLPVRSVHPEEHCKGAMLSTVCTVLVCPCMYTSVYSGSRIAVLAC